MAHKKSFDVIVIGGGPAGMMAAGQAAREGANTSLVEKTDALGKKLSITGKKRCNLTNSIGLPEFIKRFGPNGRFLHQVFHLFFRDDLLTFFKSLGVETQTERGGRVFPANGDAPFVTNTLARWVQKTGVDIFLQLPVEKLMVKDGKVTGIKTRAGQVVGSKAIVLSTGGSTFTGTGSTGDGYRMAEALGHTITPLRPALVPLKTAGNIAQKLQGLPLKNVRLFFYIDDKKRIDDFGEMLFTHFGISGPVVLTHSGKIVDALRSGKDVRVSIDLKPALDKKTLDARILHELERGGKQHFRTMLKQLLPSKMIPVCADQVGIALERPCHQVRAIERKKLLRWLKSFDLHITGSLPLEAGMVTQGGVSIQEVDPRTMMSTIIDGLFFAGEVLDLAADTGGFNLQAAFSTGWLAGIKAASFVKSEN